MNNFYNLNFFKMISKQYENKEKKNSTNSLPQKESNHSQILSQNNNNYLNKSLNPDSNKTEQCYTQRENASDLIAKIIKENNNNKNQNYNNQNIYMYYNPSKQNQYYVNNLHPTINKSSILDQHLKQLQLKYIALNNDNIIYREDIKKLMEMNKKLEKELSDERNHNYELAKENDKLNNDNQILFKKIDDVNQKITQLKIISQNEKDIMDKQIYFEEKINERDFECKKILEENNKLNLEYNLLNDKYVRLKEKNNEEEKELNILKQVQEEKINEIEKKLSSLMEEMNQLKNENIELKGQNDNYRNNIMNNDREKNEYYNKYREQKLKNDMINKEIKDIQQKYREYQKKLENKEERKIERENMRKNKSENKIKVIQDLQKRIQQYKTERAKMQND